MRVFKGMSIFAVLAFICLGSWQTASAKPKRKGSQPSPTPTALPVTRGEIALEIAASTPTPQPKTSSLELSASTYAPPHIYESTQALSTTGYTSSGLPALRVRMDHGFKHLGSCELLWHVGLGFFQMKRTGTVTVAGVSQKGEGDLQIYSVPLGASIVHPYFESQLFSGRLGVSLLPTYTLSSRSVMNDGETHFGVPIEVSVGFLFNAPWRPLSNWGLMLEGARVIKVFGDLDLSDWVIRGGVRLLAL